MKHYIIILITLFSGTALYAQHSGKRPHEGHEKIIQMKVQYVKDNLGLTEAENAKFIPVYEENLRKEEALRQKQRSMMRNMKQNYAGMSDADIEKNITEEMGIEQQLLDLKKVQFDTYKKIIPMKKVVQLKIVERAFNRMMMEKLRDKKQGPPPPENK